MRPEESLHYLPLFLLFFISLGIFLFLILSSYLLGRKKGKPNLDRSQPYHQGLSWSVKENTERYSLQYFVPALFFLIFQIQAVFVFSWCVISRKLFSGNKFFILEMGIFLIITGMGFLSYYKRGAFDWNRKSKDKTQWGRNG